MPPGRGSGDSAGRPHRPGRLRRRHRLLQVPHCQLSGELRGRGAEGQRPGGAEAPAPVPQRSGLPHDQALQRLWRRRRVCGRGRAGRRAGHRPERRAQEVRGPGRHRTCHQRVSGADGRGGGSQGRGGLHGPGRPGESGGHCAGPGHRRAPAENALERQDHCGYQQGISQFQRRGEARGGSRGEGPGLCQGHPRRFCPGLSGSGRGSERLLQAGPLRAF